MSLVKPIPIHLLPDTVTYEEYEGSERWGDTWTAPVTLSNVRVEDMSSLTMSNIREQREFKALLFFDVVISKSDIPFAFIEKSKVTHNGVEYVVNKVTPVRAFKLHHFEVELV